MSEMKRTAEVGSHLHMSLSSQLVKMMQEKNDIVELSGNTAERNNLDNNDDDDNAINKALDYMLTSGELDLNEEELENNTSCQDSNSNSSNNYIIRDVQFVKYMPHTKSFSHVLLLKLILFVMSDNRQTSISTNKCTWMHGDVRKLLLKYALYAQSLHPYTILLLFYYCQSDVLLQENMQELGANPEIINERSNSRKTDNETTGTSKNNNNKNNSDNCSSENRKMSNKDNKYDDETCVSYMLALATILSRKSALLNDGLTRAEHLRSATEYFFKQLSKTHSSVLATRRFIALMSQTALTSLYCGALRSVSLMTTIIDVAVIEIYGRSMLHLDAETNKNLDSSRELSTAVNDESTSLTLIEEEHMHNEKLNGEDEVDDNGVSEQNMMSYNLTVKIHEYDKYVAEALETLESFAQWSLQKSSQLGVISAHLGIKSSMTKEASAREGQAREIITSRNVQITPLEIAFNMKGNASTSTFTKTAQERNALRKTHHEQRGKQLFF